MRSRTDSRAAAPNARRLRVVADEVGDPSAEVGEVAGAVEPAVDAAPHQIQRAAPPGRDDRHAARERLLDALAERLALAGVHEDVEARDGLGERVAGEEPEERGVRQLRLELRRARVRRRR